MVQVVMTLRQAKEGFFDRKKVIARTDAAILKVHSKFGAFVRQRARTSIRYRAKPSDPGNPPSAHRTMMRTKTNKKTGRTTPQAVSPLREFIFFAQDPAARSVVIGPVALPGRGGPPVLKALEKGGPSRVRTGAGARGFLGGWRRVGVRARPFMKPAFEEELRGLGRLWANAIS